MKYIFLGLISLFSVYVEAAGLGENNLAEGIGISTSVTLPTAFNETWNFEIKNKDKKALYITIQNGNKLVTYRRLLNKSRGSKESQHSYLRLSGLNLGLPVLITLENEDLANPKGYMIERGARDRTIFVSYEKGKLRTQSGKGWFDKETQSGLSLKKNISDDDIEQQPESVIEDNLEEIRKKQIAAHTQAAFELEDEDPEEEELGSKDLFAKNKRAVQNKSMNDKSPKMPLKF